MGQKRLEFLSPEFVEMLEHACAEAKRLDLRLALTLGMGWRIYAEVHLNRQVPWWPTMKSLNRYIARTQWVLQAGGPVSDLLAYPVRSNPPDGPYNLATDQPASAINAVDGASPYTLARIQKRGSESPYDFSRLVLIDDVRTLDEARRILRFVENGAILVCCNVMPDERLALRDVGSRGP